MNLPGAQPSDPDIPPQIDYTNKDYASLREAMLALGREKLPEWTDQSANDPGVVLVDLFAYMGDILLYYQDRLANESYLDTAVERRSVMNMLRLIGCELRPSRPASADFTLLFGLDAIGSLTIETDTEFKVTTRTSNTPISFRYVLEPLTINLDTLPATSYGGADYKTQILPVVQVNSRSENVPIGSSAGSAGQRFSLAQPLLIDESLQIRVGGELWTRRETLLYSYSNSQDFVLRRDENDVAWVEFGDGKFGKIPPVGSDNVTATYRLGGGPVGNVPPLSKIAAASALSDSDKNNPKFVVNYGAATGGANSEDIASAVSRGPQLFRARSRAVTAEDYEAFARDFGVGKVSAQAPGWNTVVLYVAPIGGGYPSDTLKEDLRLYFEDKRMLTTVVQVADPTYIPVTIEADLYLKRTYLQDQVVQNVLDAVSRLIAFDNVKFGDRLFISSFYEKIEEVTGVAGVNITRFTLTRDAIESVALPPSGLLDFLAHEIPQAMYSNAIKLTVILGGPGAR